jgi:ATP-binding cassette subfamily C protein LapB
LTESVDNEKKDSLLESLVLFTKLYHEPYSAEALTAGLPIEQGIGSTELFTIGKGKSLFSRAASRAGLKTKIMEKKLSEIPKYVLPAILILKNKDSCILESIDYKNGKAKIISPEMGEAEMWVNLNELEETYTGYVFYLKKEYQYNDRKHNTLDVKQKHWFWGTVWMSKDIYRDVLLASLVINMFILASPLFTMNVYDRVVPNNAIETMWVLAIGIFVVHILDFVLKMTRSYFLELAAKKSDIIISSRLFEKVMDLSMSEKPKSVGSFANNLRDFDSIRSFLTTSTMTAFIDFPFTIIFLAVITVLGGELVVVPITVISIILIYSFFVKEPLRQSIEATQEASANKNSILIESLVNLETIKTMGASSHAQWKWEEATGEIANKGVKSKILSATIPNFNAFFTQVNTIAIMIFGVYKLQEMEMTMGALIAIVMLSGRAISPFGQMASLTTQYQQSKQAYDGLQKIMDMQVERPAEKKFIQRVKFTGDIEFKNVTFKYGEEENPALDNVSLKIRAGEKVGIIGRVGSGKTTVEKLILGLYEPTNGTVSIDGIDIKQIDPADLRKNIAYVPQDIVLFKGTVRQNILMKNPHVSDSSIIEAARVSGSELFTNTHPKGFDMDVEERGESLSGGQRQSLAIARAFTVDTSIALLDEPTNMMDGTTEAYVKHNLYEKFEDKTIILVTHKYSLLDLVDRVIVFENGKIALDGPKQEVMKKLKGE